MIRPPGRRAIAATVANLAALAIAAAAVAQTTADPDKLGAGPAAVCGAPRAPVPASAIDSAAMISAISWAIAERGPTPAARMTAATPAHGRPRGEIAPGTRQVTGHR